MQSADGTRGDEARTEGRGHVAVQRDRAGDQGGRHHGTLIAYSFGKILLTPGERLGWLALGADMPELRIRICRHNGDPAELIGRRALCATGV